MLNFTSINIDDFKARYGRCGIFVILAKDGSTHKFVKEVLKDGKPGNTLAAVSHKLDTSKDMQVTTIIETDDTTGEVTRDFRVLCNKGASAGDLALEL